MAAPTIKDALAAETFDLKDQIIAALEAAGITDPQRIYRYGGNALLKTPMEEVKAFVDSKLKPHKAELASTDPDVLTAVADFVAALVSKVPVASAGAAAPAATTASSGGSLDKERAAADAFAQERYAAVAQATLYRVSAKDRLASKIVKRLSDEIDRGTISAESYKLTGLSSALSTESESKTSVGNDVSIVTSKAATFALGHHGEILIAEVRFLDGLMAAGFRPVTPHASNPQAGSCGTKGLILVPDPGDPSKTVSERWNLTPEFCRQYLMSVIVGITMLAPPDLLAARNRFWELTVEIIEADFNVETSGLTILERHTMVRRCPRPLSALPASVPHAARVHVRRYLSPTACARPRAALTAWPRCCSTSSPRTPRCVPRWPASRAPRLARSAPASSLRRLRATSRFRTSTPRAARAASASNSTRARAQRPSAASGTGAPCAASPRLSARRALPPASTRDVCKNCTRPRAHVHTSPHVERVCGLVGGTENCTCVLAMHLSLRDLSRPTEPIGRSELVQVCLFLFWQ